MQLRPILITAKPTKKPEHLFFISIYHQMMMDSGKAFLQ